MIFMTDFQMLLKLRFTKAKEFAQFYNWKIKKENIFEQI